MMYYFSRMGSSIGSTSLTTPSRISTRPSSIARMILSLNFFYWLILITITLGKSSSLTSKRFLIQLDPCY